MYRKFTIYSCITKNKNLPEKKFHNTSICSSYKRYFNSNTYQYKLENKYTKCFIINKVYVIYSNDYRHCKLSIKTFIVGKHKVKCKINGLFNMM